jgi:hypothetical protein
VIQNPYGIIVKGTSPRSVNKKMRRREFLTAAGALTSAAAFPPLRAFAGRPDETAYVLDRSAADAGDEAAISFWTSDPIYQARYQSALDLLAANTLELPGYSKPVLIEGSSYRGIWLECAPHEGLVYAPVRSSIARNNHAAFFDLQREDGQIPCNIKVTGIGHGQIQMVAPIAATAWELAQQTGDSRLLETAYTSCGRWDAWLRRYRDTRHTGLCEGFCTYDTGHDNSPRWAGLPNGCPDGDARKCPPLPSLPRLCPDLSATVYGGRVALAAMAQALGKNSEADRWLEDAAAIRAAILRQLYDAAEATFFDLDAQNQFVRIRGDLISRVLGEHVVDAKLFGTIYRRQIHNPDSFWAPYPLPSIALDDPSFVRPIPPNSWGGASQALTALRAPRWMEHYDKPADLGHLMQQWVTALLRATDFRQQLDPLNGNFSDGAPGYSPAALVLLDFTWRLAGVRHVGGNLEWNVRPALAGARSSFRLRGTPLLTAEMKYESGRAELRLNDRSLCRVSGVVRLITTADGKLRSAVGIGAEASSVVLQPAVETERRFVIEPNHKILLA